MKLPKFNKIDTGVFIIFFIFSMVCMYFLLSGDAYKVVESTEPEPVPVRTVKLDDIDFQGNFTCRVLDVNDNIVAEISGELLYSQLDSYSIIIHESPETLRKKYGKNWIFQQTDTFYFIPGGKLKIYPGEER